MNHAELDTVPMGGLANPEILNTLHEGVYLVDLDCRIQFWNNAATAISGYAAESVIGKRCSNEILVHVDHCGKQKCDDGCPLRQSIKDGLQHEVDVYLLHKEGHRVSVSVRTAPIQDAQGNVIGGLEAFTHRGSQGQRLNELEAIAFNDPLTGIANRRCFENRLAQAVDDTRASETPLSIIIIDVNGFKPVNDTYGHVAGDAVLQTVAKTLRESVRRTDLVARWGGDEFAIILPGAPLSVAEDACKRIQALIEQVRTHHESNEICVTVSTGCALLNPTEEAGSLFRRADQYLYENKVRRKLPSSIAVEESVLSASQATP